MARNKTNTIDTAVLEPVVEIPMTKAMIVDFPLSSGNVLRMSLVAPTAIMDEITGNSLVVVASRRAIRTKDRDEAKAAKADLLDLTAGYLGHFSWVQEGVYAPLSNKKVADANLTTDGMKLAGANEAQIKRIVARIETVTEADLFAAVSRHVAKYGKVTVA